MNTPPVIVMVEDEPDIVDLARFHLEREGYQLAAIGDASDLTQKVIDLDPQLVILDLMLPGQNGLDACKALKAHPKTQHIPILIASAKSEDGDIVTGLELGADDYLPKPFSPKVLVARVRALLRRTPTATPAPEPAPNKSDPLNVHDLSINPQTLEVKYKGQPISLNVSEFKTLQVLAQKPGWVLSRYQIVEAIRGENYIVTDRTVDVLIVGLRKKLGLAGHLIETMRGVGYRFKPL